MTFYKLRILLKGETATHGDLYSYISGFTSRTRSDDGKAVLAEIPLMTRTASYILPGRKRN